MVTLAHATHHFCLLAPLFLAVLMLHMAAGNTRNLPPLLFQPIQPQPGQKKSKPKMPAPSKPRRNIPYKMIIWSTIFGVLVIGSAWLTILRSVAFDWDLSDIAEMEIQQFALNDVVGKPQKTVAIKDADDLQSILDTVPAVQPSTQPSEYSIGRCYLLRAKRKSDGKWSNYTLQVIQDRETANSPKLKRVFLAYLTYDSSTIKLGDYEATTLGEALDKIANRPPGPKNLALKAKYESSDPNKYSWGINGLTDGSWNGNSSNCYATGDSPAFPKIVTVDLGKAYTINQMNFGVPKFGSTRTVSASISKDGKTFTDVGSYKFTLRKEEKTTLKFTAAEARYVRLTFVDNYTEKVDYSPAFGFITELEVFAAGK